MKESEYDTLMYLLAQAKKELIDLQTLKKIQELENELKVIRYDHQDKQPRIN